MSLYSFLVYNDQSSTSDFRSINVQNLELLRVDLKVYKSIHNKKQSREPKRKQKRILVESYQNI